MGWISTLIKGIAQNVDSALQTVTQVVTVQEQTTQVGYQSDVEKHNTSLNTNIATNQTMVIVVGVVLAIIVLATQLAKTAKYKYK